MTTHEIPNACTTRHTQTKCGARQLKLEPRFVVCLLCVNTEIRREREEREEDTERYLVISIFRLSVYRVSLSDVSV